MSEEARNPKDSTSSSSSSPASSTPSSASSSFSAEDDTPALASTISSPTLSTFAAAGGEKGWNRAENNARRTHSSAHLVIGGKSNQQVGPSSSPQTPSASQAHSASKIPSSSSTSFLAPPPSSSKEPSSKRDSGEKTITSDRRSKEEEKKKEPERKGEEEEKLQADLREALVDPRPVISRLHHTVQQQSRLIEELQQKVNELEEQIRKSGDAKSVKLQLTVRSPELTLTTAARDTIKKLKNKFPGDTTNYYLFLKDKIWNSFTLLEDEKTLATYKQLEDPKTVLDFLNINKMEERGKNRYVRKNLTMSRAMGAELAALEKITLDVFLRAIVNNEVASIRKYLNTDLKYECLNELDEEGQTALHAAVRAANPQTVELFLKYYLRMGMNVNVTDKYGWTIMHTAVSNGRTDTDDEVLKLILDTPDLQVDVENQDLNTPLHYFCQKFLSPSCQELGELIIRAAPETVNKRNKNGETPLHKAIFNPAVRILMVKLLIKHGADVNIPNSIGGETALHYAVRLQRKDLVKILLNAGADITIKESREGKTPYDLSKMFDTSQDKEISDMLKTVQDVYDWLKKHKLDELFQTFIKQEMYLETLTSLQEWEIDGVLDGLKIDAMGQRIKVKTAIADLRGQQSKKQFEETLKKVQKKDDKLQSTGEEQVRQLMQSLGSIVDSNLEDGWLIQSSAMEFTKELGTGASGKVFKGLYQGVKVAIKVLKAVDNKAMKDFKKEFHVMSVLRSANIVHFFGACLEPKVCMVMEYCSRGSLNDVLRKPGLDITWKQAISFAAGMTKGMLSLHSREPPIFHRDMKSLNLLVAKDWTVKVCDFGLARFNTVESQQTMTKMVGTYAYLGPEIFYAKPFTDKTDIWAMGVILWELACRLCKGKYEAPYAELNLKLDFQILYQVAEKGKRPTMPLSTPDIWKTLILKCMETAPESRPTCAEIGTMLDNVMANYVQFSAEWENTRAKVA